MWNTQGGGPGQEAFQARESERLSTVTVPMDSSESVSPRAVRDSRCTLGSDIGAVGWLCDFVQLRDLCLPKGHDV